MFAGVSKGIALSNRVSTLYHIDIYTMTFSTKIKVFKCVQKMFIITRTGLILQIPLSLTH